MTMLILYDPIKRIELLMRKLKEFGTFPGFKINNQKINMLTKI